jgi:hypothetical protein
MLTITVAAKARNRKWPMMLPPWYGAGCVMEKVGVPRS